MVQALRLEVMLLSAELHKARNASASIDSGAQELRTIDLDLELVTMWIGASLSFFIHLGFLLREAGLCAQLCAPCAFITHAHVGAWQ